ncbi:hypothetical protein PENANT_c026G09285 [Penicillium antarcticum]|uniref:NF-kappa-B inhibitor-like protein 1 n=1 Tax=Penicillium antarcticum TaxID=416450 RepID=A0A1V6PXG8_9EURO|nr:uncharacterized protein N7508_000130 [Penicillium antarcticum]KAJ5319847.1 hypothetical protein N7508_000130 [Penicillium antarcticum]OQD81671.1 hypothetical protein PENANT_c026G09285 [Penicillium antarcticum]
MDKGTAGGTTSPSLADPSKPDEYNPEVYSQSRSKGKFRFKRSSRHSKDSHTPSSSSARPHRKRHRSHRSRSPSKHSKRRHRSPTPPTQPPLNTNDAFRESLFDALGDDEGAAYWESVYGQPIHNYSIPNVPKGPDGELEQMSDEEYVSYVRTRMWERTREGMIEEQERLRAERMRHKKKEEKGRTAEAERRAFEQAMDDSLRRGAERKKLKAWDGAWREYLQQWDVIGRLGKEAADGAEGEKGSSKPLRNLLFWPVRSGKRADVEPEAVEEFMRHAPGLDLLSILKAERIRWHPDKIQHRYGALGIDDVAMRSVTEVFQIVDRMWSEERERQS